MNLSAVCYQPIHFKTQEFVSPDFYAKAGEAALWAMDSRMLWTIDAIRDRYNKSITVNNWLWNTNSADPCRFTMRGFRPPEFNDGAKFLSQHKCGRAIDFDVKGMTAEEVRQDIIKNWKTEPAFQYITTLEINVNWVHMDCRNTNMATLFLVNPL